MRIVIKFNALCDIFFPAQSSTVSEEEDREGKLEAVTSKEWGKVYLSTERFRKIYFCWMRWRQQLPPPSYEIVTWELETGLHPIVPPRVTPATRNGGSQIHWNTCHGAWRQSERETVQLTLVLPVLWCPNKKSNFSSILCWTTSLASNWKICK